MIYQCQNSHKFKGQRIQIQKVGRGHERGTGSRFGTHGKWPTVLHGHAK